MTGLEVDIQEGWDQDYDLINVEYVDGKWLSIYDNNFGRSGYSTSDSLLEFKADVEKFNNDGFDLVGVEYSEGTLVGVFSKDDYNYTTYSVSRACDQLKSDRKRS